MPPPAEKFWKRNLRQQLQQMQSNNGRKFINYNKELGQRCRKLMLTPSDNWFSAVRKWIVSRLQMTCAPRVRSARRSQDRQVAEPLVACHKKNMKKFYIKNRQHVIIGRRQQLNVGEIGIRVIDKEAAPVVLLVYSLGGFLWRRQEAFTTMISQYSLVSS